MKGIFAFLQKLGRAFMLPIAILPMAGLLLGIGSAFTNPVTIEKYNLVFLDKGTILHTILSLCANIGGLVFANLPILFAVGIAIGLANKNKETAALSALLGFLVFHSTISFILGLKGLTPETTTVEAFLAQGFSEGKAYGTAALFAKELGIFTLQVGVFGGIIVGIITAFLTNKFSDVSFPDYLAFFSGNRFVPIMTILSFLVVAAIFPFIWPSIFGFIVRMGTLFGAIGPIGTFFYGFTMRILNIFGLHHAIYPLFWYTPIGGQLEVAGNMIYGGQNIFFAQLQHSKMIEHFSVIGTKTMTGGFLPMMFGLPAAALAMYRTADVAKRKLIKGILLSAALTSFITGITEPLEFTFLFVAPPLYVIHAILEGLAYMLMEIMNVAVGITFSRGIIDFTLFGLLQGAAKTSYYWILILGPVYAIIYYYIFKFMIVKFNYATPGRGDADIELKTRKDYNAHKTGSKDELIDDIVEALGGVENIANIDACITRLRVTVKDETLVSNKDIWASLHAKGVIQSGKGVQIIYGTQAEIYKNKIKEKYQIR